VRGGVSGTLRWAKRDSVTGAPLRKLTGRAADPPTAPAGGSDGSTSQLVQAMAGFGGGSGAGESLNTAPLGADTSQQQFLTTPQHV
jgi:hypothetical protein